MRKGTERRTQSPAGVHEISQRAMGFRLLLPADSGTRFGPRSLERGGKSLHFPPCETTGSCSDAL